MSKFHINKHGVPAPCKAKSGNCPLGGDDTHFDNMEDAQAHADKVNEEEHSLLPKVEEKEPINQGYIDLENEHFELLFDSYSSNMYGGVGVHIVDLNEIVDYPGTVDEEDQKAYEELYYEISESNLSYLLRNDRSTLVPEINVRKYFDNHIVNRNSDYGETTGYDDMAETVERIYPEKITKDMSGRKVIDDEIEDEIIDFATEKSLSESGLQIFREPAIVGTYDDRNWAEEYFQSKGIL